MDDFEKKLYLEGIYIKAIELYNICIFDFNVLDLNVLDLNVPDINEWLYNESFYRYKFNHMKYNINNESIYDYYYHMCTNYPEGYGLILKNTFESKISHNINFTDLYFEMIN